MLLRVGEWWKESFSSRQRLVEVNKTQSSLPDARSEAADPGSGRSAWMGSRIQKVEMWLSPLRLYHFGKVNRMVCRGWQTVRAGAWKAAREPYCQGWQNGRACCRKRNLIEDWGQVKVLVIRTIEYRDRKTACCVRLALFGAFEAAGYILSLEGLKGHTAQNRGHGR